MRITRFLVLVAVFFLCLSGLPVADAKDDATVSRKELQRIKREMREKKKEIKRADRKERSILSDLERMDREVQAGKAELAAQQKRLREAEASLRHVEKSNADIIRELARLKQMYGMRVRALYKMSRNGYAAAMLVSDDQGDSLKRIKYLSMIAERDRVLIRDYGNSLNRLAVQQAEIAEKKQAFVERQREIEIKKTEQEARKREKAVLLANVREKKGLYEQTLHELEESSASLWGMIRKAEQERKATKASQQPPKQPVHFSNIDSSRLPWPLEGQVLTRFGTQRHPQFKTMVFRRGIEIAAREGEPVHAVSDGQVAYADWYKGYGKLMIIEHAAGFYTLYGNLSRLDLNKGDRVLRSQVIGLAGDTGSLKGSKLYFEIRRNGEAQDPLLWLAKR